MDAFFDRFNALADRTSPFCMGIDPSASTLAKCGLADDADGLRRFCDLLVDAAAGITAIVKPQLAFFERFGPGGLREFQRTCERAHGHGLLVLADAKRGDIGSTCEGYAHAFLAPKGPYRADAMTVNPYLGFGGLRSLLDIAADAGAGVFAVVRSSNPEGAALQSARVATGGTVAEMLAGEIAAYNASKGANVVGAVLGATIGDGLGPILDALDGGLVLAPGIGAQGATFADLEAPFGAVRRSVLPSVSRGVLANGFGAEAVRAAVAESAAAATRFRRG